MNTWRRQLTWLLAGSFLLIAFGAGQLPLLGPDEPRYSQVAREMLQRRDLITPTLAGRPWFEKPVLLYWLQDISYCLFGVSEWAARFPSLLAALFTIFFITATARRLAGSGTALLCGIVLASSVFLAGFGRAATFDMLLTACVTASLCAFLRYEVEPRRAWLWMAYGAAGAGLLAKGFVAPAVIGLAMLTHLGMSGRLRRLMEYRPVHGALIAAAVAAVWFVPVTLIHGGRFWDDFFLQHHLARYTSSQFHRSQGILYYVPVLLLGSFPWTPALFLRSPANPGIRRLRLFAWCWLLSSLAFFSLSQSKLPGYILPAAPAIAILVGTSLGATAEQKKRSIGLFAAFHTLVIAALLIGAGRFDVPQPPIYALAGAIAILTAAGLVLLQRDHLRAALLCGTGITATGVLIAVLLLYPATTWNESRMLAASISPELNREQRLLLYNVYDFSLVYYTNARVELTHDGYFPALSSDRDLYRWLRRAGTLRVVVVNEDLEWIQRVRFWRVENVLHGPVHSIVMLRSL